jgi:hypothetical protein
VHADPTETTLDVRDKAGGYGYSMHPEWGCHSNAQVGMRMYKQWSRDPSRAVAVTGCVCIEFERPLSLTWSSDACSISETIRAALAKNLHKQKKAVWQVAG